jgi:hypothetical protein
MIMIKRKADWTPTMEQRAGLEGRQVKCLIASEGHLWMQHYYDRFPGAVRRRLAASPFNICREVLQLPLAAKCTRKKMQRHTRTAPMRRSMSRALGHLV